MSITSSVILSSQIDYEVTETGTGQDITEDQSISVSINMSFGTGTGQCNAFIKQTGNISEDDSILLDFENITKNVFDKSYSLNFSNVKGFIVENLGTGIDDYISIDVQSIPSTLTGLFGDSNSGGYMIPPEGSFVFFDYFGDLKPASLHQNLQLLNLNVNDPVGYKYTIVGVTG